MHRRLAHRPPPFRAVLKPDRSRATKTGQLTSQLQPLNADYLTDGLGANLDGMLAEYTVLSEEALVPAPKHLSVEEAASSPCAAVTAWVALTGIAG